MTEGNRFQAFSFLTVTTENTETFSCVSCQIPSRSVKEVLFTGNGDWAPLVP